MNIKTTFRTPCNFIRRLTHCFVLLFFLASASSAGGQNVHPQFDSLYRKGRTLWRQDRQAVPALDTLRAARVLARRLDLPLGECLSLLQMGIILDLTGESLQSEALLKSADTIAIQYNFLAERKRVLSALTETYFYANKYDKALTEADQLLVLARESGDSVMVVNSLQYKSNSYFSKGDLNRSMDAAIDGLSVSEQIRDSLRIGWFTKQMGLLHKVNGELEEALVDYLKAVVLGEKLQDPNFLAGVYNDIGIVYKELKQFEKAGENYEKSLKILRALKNEQGVMALSINQGILKYNLEEYGQAIPYLDSGLVRARQFNQKEAISDGLGYKSRALVKLGRINEAISLAQESKTLAMEINNLEKIRDATLAQSEAYQGQGDFRKSLAHYQEYIAYRDSLSSEERTRIIGELEAKYETAKNEEELNRQKNQIQLLKQKRKAVGMQRNLVLILLLLGALTTWLFMRSRRKKRELAQQKEVNERLHRVNAATSKFVPSEFLRSLGRENITEVALGDHAEKEVSVLFSDIRAYTTLSEQMTPGENFKFVNAYHGQTGPHIKNNLGFVNQYLGDGIMALFPEHPRHALQAAIEMQKSVRSYNKRRVLKKRRPIKIGIGIHTGNLIMGVIGDAHRMDAATISDTVNTAARVESLSKYYGANILLSEQSLWKIVKETTQREVVSETPAVLPKKPLNYSFRYLGLILVKGKKEPIGIYECFDGDEPAIAEKKRQTLPVFKEALIDYFMMDFAKSVTAFQEILRQNEADAAARHFLTKSSYYLKHGAPEGWEGIEMMERK